MSVAVIARQHSASAAPAAAPVQRARPVAAHAYLARTIQKAALATGAAVVVALSGAGSAEARSTLLDLPSCSKFQQAAAGIEFCDVRQGSGDSPQLGDQVEVDYTARVADSGKVYDGSRGFQFTLGEGEVVRGWELAMLGDEGLPAVKEGGVRTVRIPATLAYGEDGYGCLYGLSTSCRIPPNSSVLITFEYKGNAF